MPNILIVDDVALFREMGSLFLSRSGRVRTAENAAQALELIEQRAPDVVLTDQGMPEMTGIELCRQLKNDPETADISVVVMSGIEPGERAEAIHAGADDVLAKPLARADLIEAVSRFGRPGPVRGLPRVEVDTAVRVRVGGDETWGTVRNLSRGGLFVEIAERIEGELSLHFDLPEEDGGFDSRAEVVWRRESFGGRAAFGAGLRFLEMDRRQLRSLADYVYERFRPAAAAPSRRSL